MRSYFGRYRKRPGAACTVARDDRMAGPSSARERRRSRWKEGRTATTVADAEGDPSGPSRCTVESPRDTDGEEEARGTAATGSRERRHSDEERRGEEKMQESASTNQHPHQHQLTEAAQASLGRGVSRSVDSHSRHIILILSLYSSHTYPYPCSTVYSE